MLTLPAGAAANALRQGLDQFVPAIRWRRLGLLGCALLFCLLLTACGGGPPRKVLLQGLALQVRLTQETLGSALRLEPLAAPQISRVRIEDQDRISIDGQRAYRVRGHFDWRLSGDAIRTDSSFEIFLQPGEQALSWRLAQPVGSRDGTQQGWRSFQIEETDKPR
ncbi:MAG: hypothetical protein ERJ67_05370 [Aphanocapsa feldmannii 277cV]|uniref:Uncharacterized protein n=2 Tax=Aphanocapsa feldmannii TaxID=192050 RepID=A0A524RNK2_9CHRO|nr:MAG: hypothetical protein ERJ67_05370 [Aphanocapsa feldmannii 277cV]TGH24023.1 MAG: hypothetical protein ERJ68_03590 [Aphanocapsa feldmannii 277cI]